MIWREEERNDKQKDKEEEVRWGLWKELKEE